MVHHFADDTNILLFDSSNSLKSLQKTINIDLKILCHWLLNTSKLNIFYFDTSKNLSPLILKTKIKW